MSYTEIYRLGSQPGCIGEVRNSWRGAMFVWNDVAKRYCGMEGFSPFGSGASKVWNSFKNPRMPEWERIVLATTLDNALVFADDRIKLIEAFKTYARERGGSLGEQADVISATNFAPGDAIAWNQTSVNCDVWCRMETETEDDVVYSWYDPQTGDKHFDVMVEVQP
jgi:hypothetical protein